jgi:hypothetical protein
MQRGKELRREEAKISIPKETKISLTKEAKVALPKNI